MNLLFNIPDYDEEEIKKREAKQLKHPLTTDECYKNGYHPSRWELGQVFLNGIWKPFKLNSILQYKKRTRLELKPDTICPNATLLDDTNDKEITLYEMFESMPSDRPMVLICGSFT